MHQIGFKFNQFISFRELEYINYNDLTLIPKFSIMAFNYEPQFLKEQLPPTRIFYQEIIME